MFMGELARTVGEHNQRQGFAEELNEQSGPAIYRMLKNCGRNEVASCGVASVGDQWAGGETVLPALLGKNTDPFNASEKMWAFYSRHPR
jgi:poly(3-hydroxybutyrate) depolymerase